MAQLSMNLCGLSGSETVRPYAAGDVLVKHNGARYVVEQVERDDEAAEPEVLLCLGLATGNSAILFPREVAYRSGR